MKKNGIQSLILALAITAFIILSSVLLSKGITVDPLENSLKINGLYGTEIAYKDIEDVKELEAMPIWGLKTNGINLGFMNIGMFTYKEFGKVRLFEIKKEKPYVLIIGKTDKVILGLGKEKNEEIFSIVEKKLKSIQR